MATRYPCQQCGGKCNFVAKTRNRRVTGQKEHDLCRKCWKSSMMSEKVRQAAECGREPR